MSSLFFMSGGQLANSIQPDLNGTDYINNTRSAQLPHGNTYRYVHYPPFQGKPTLLFLHGFPSTSFDFRRQFAFFSEKGYGIIAPDLLGYGGSSKPSSLDSYRLKFMAQDLADLLDCIGATKIISVGHDWGSLMNSRFITYHGDRLIATVFLDIGYFAPPLSIGPGTAKALNTMTSLTLGYPIFGYWFFFNDTSAPALLNSHVSNLFAIACQIMFNPLTNPSPTPYPLSSTPATQNFKAKTSVIPSPLDLGSQQTAPHPPHPGSQQTSYTPSKP